MVMACFFLNGYFFEKKCSLERISLAVGRFGPLFEKSRSEFMGKVPVYYSLIISAARSTLRLPFSTLHRLCRRILIRKLQIQKLQIIVMVFVGLFIIQLLQQNPLKRVGVGIVG